MQNPEQHVTEWSNDARLIGTLHSESHRQNNLLLSYVVYEFVIRNFKSPDGRLSVSLGSSYTDWLALLGGLGKQYNHINGVDPKTGKEVTVQVLKKIVKGKEVLQYFPVFGEGLFSTCLVMRLCGVKQYTVPAVVTDQHGSQVSVMDARNGWARRALIKTLLQVGIPHITIKINNYVNVASYSVKAMHINDDNQLHRLCVVSHDLFEEETHLNIAQGAVPADVYENIVSNKDKQCYLDIMFPGANRAALRNGCLQSGNLDSLVTQCHYVPFLLMCAAQAVAGQPSDIPVGAVNDYCKALLLSTHEKPLQAAACQGLFNIKEQLEGSEVCSLLMLRTLSEVIVKLNEYDIDILKDLLLRPFGLKELLSKDACHRPGPWRVEGFAPRFFMSMLHKYESVTREYSADTAMEYLSVMVMGPAEFEELKQQCSTNNMPEPLRALVDAIQRGESPLPAYLQNEAFKARMSELGVEIAADVVPSPQNNNNL